jgi:hypothetical protein
MDKDTILIIVSIISVVTAVAMFIFGVYQRRKSKKLEEEKFLYQREQDAKKELKEFIETSGIKQGKRTAAQLYCDHIGQKFKYLDFTGLNAILQKPLLLEDVYVNLQLKEYNDPFIDAFDHLLEEAGKKGEPLSIVISGPPGSGKTTLLKWIALQCSSPVETIFSQFIPVFIPLRIFGQTPDKTYRTKNIIALTTTLLNNENIPSTFIENAFDNDQLLFLLDGLDEIPDEAQRKEVIEWIQNQNIGNNTLLVTSRPAALQSTTFQDAIPVFTIRDFDIADIERFLEYWYRNIEVTLTGETGAKEKEQTLQKGKNQYEDLMNIIKSSNYQNLRQLAVNPLLLTIIAIVHRTRAVLPKERHKLYEECLRVMIELWNVANKKLDVSFSVENSMDNLSRIAFHLMKENRREVKPAIIKTLLPQEIENHPRDIFLNEMVLKAGLLYESADGYGFIIRAFQEYLAAWYFFCSENQNAILEHRAKDWWNEAFKLFVNIAHTRSFFNEIIDNLFDYEKDYWPYMPLWNDCLQDIVVEETRQEIELKLAGKIREFIPVQERDKWNGYTQTGLLDYFAHLDKPALKAFQFNNPEFLARELRGGNFKALGEASILPETLDKVERYVQFDSRTIEKLLEFKIDFEDQWQNLLPIRAFLILKRADFKKLRESIVNVIQNHKNEQLRVNALYIFKKVN